MSAKIWFMSLLILLILFLFMLSGCSLGGTEATLTSISDAISEVQSVETTILLDLQAHTEETDSSGSHSASLTSDITIVSTLDPLAYHAEYFSRILVDNAASREDKEIYVVPDKNGYFRYEYNAKKDVWEESILTQAEEKAVPLKMGVIQDWGTLLGDLTLEESNIEADEEGAVDKYEGMADSSILEELIGDQVFGSFLYSLNQLMDDQIPCILYVDTETSLPTQLILDFKENFMVSDMIFDNATITVNYSSWNETNKISVPKKVSIVSENPDADFYSSFFAWNLFLPYVGGDGSEAPEKAPESLSFSSAWDTFQIRLDNRLTTLPFSYEELNKLGYVLDESCTDIIIEPNKYVVSIPVWKGEDKIQCAFFNDGTTAQPITSCKIGSLDIRAQEQKTNEIKLFLPGEIVLGTSKQDLLAAYGDAAKVKSSFACDTYTWNGEGKRQSFLAEISPTNNQVIRLKLENIPVTGGKQK